MKRSILLLLLCVPMFFTACSKDKPDYTDEFTNTVWSGTTLDPVVKHTFTFLPNEKCTYVVQPQGEDAVSDDASYNYSRYGFVSFKSSTGGVIGVATIESTESMLLNFDELTGVLLLKQ